MHLFRIALLGMVAFCGALRAEEGMPGDPSATLPDGLYAEFATSHGSIIVRLLADEAPMTTANFVGLTEGTIGPRQGHPYYTGLTWYRVVPGFVIQSGNPNHPGEGDAGYTFPDEFSPGLRHDAAGVLSMANGGPDTNSAEFFLTLGEQTRLNYLHSVFGRVVRGLELLSHIKEGDAFSVKILRIGAAALAFQADEASFKQRVAKARRYAGESAPGPTAHFDDPNHLLPGVPPRAQAFNFKLANFHRATGIKIVARLFAKSPPAEADAVAGAYMRGLAEKLGVARRGALVAYFADEDDWRVWIGDDSTSAFLGRTATTEDLVEEGAFHHVKENFLSATHAAGEAAFFAQQTAAPQGQEPTQSQRLKLQTDAILDGLIFKLEPQAVK